MSNVIQFDAPKKGDTSFMMCGCKPENPEPYIVVAITDNDRPIIAGLLCPQCETQLDVVNGIVQTP